MADAQSTADQETLKALIFQRLHPRIYLERFIAENVRPDGREFAEWRDITVNVGSISTADGSALVRLGDTTIVCGVKAEIAEPELDRPNAGFLVPNIDLPAMSSPKFKPGPPSEEAQVLSDRLNNVLVSCAFPPLRITIILTPFLFPFRVFFFLSTTSSGVIPLDSLCIHPGKAVWVLYVDATCINYDGNAFDAALVAMVSALKNSLSLFLFLLTPEEMEIALFTAAHLPKATFDEDTGRTTCSRKIRTPLAISRLPLSLSFGLFDSSHLLADPTSFEEPLVDTTFSVVLDQDHDLISLTQLGLTDSRTQDILSTCIEAAKQRHRTLDNKIYSF
ncbi:hypothetical protein EW146_g4613 [Bondarzewia mesenterica]|uniref:Ribosomal RNA-processing protein 43 n=1 Tax=Bondarzewia mesenterica TaxID=1095465 RepID=A0A4S4LU11_9AGAM|nr:hypothetical protein EW146_g4613 [Bondarzewia mesenterica]